MTATKLLRCFSSHEPILRDSVPEYTTLAQYISQVRATEPVLKRMVLEDAVKFAGNDFSACRYAVMVPTMDNKIHQKWMTAFLKEVDAPDEILSWFVLALQSDWTKSRVAAVGLGTSLERSTTGKLEVRLSAYISSASPGALEGPNGEVVHSSILAAKWRKVGPSPKVALDAYIPLESDVGFHLETLISHVASDASSITNFINCVLDVDRARLFLRLDVQLAKNIVLHHQPANSLDTSTALLLLPLELQKLRRQALTKKVAARRAQTFNHSSTLPPDLYFTSNCLDAVGLLHSSQRNIQNLLNATNACNNTKNTLPTSVRVYLGAAVPDIVTNEVEHSDVSTASLVSQAIPPPVQHLCSTADLLPNPTQQSLFAPEERSRFLAIGPESSTIYTRSLGTIKRLNQLI